MESEEIILVEEGVISAIEITALEGDELEVNQLEKQDA